MSTGIYWCYVQNKSGLVVAFGMIQREVDCLPTGVANTIYCYICLWEVSSWRRKEVILAKSVSDARSGTYHAHSVRPLKHCSSSSSSSSNSKLFSNLVCLAELFGSCAEACSSVCADR